MKTTLARGQKTPLAALGAPSSLGVDPSVTLEVSVFLDLSGGPEVDVCCFGLDAEGRLADERYFIFYNQPVSPCGALRLAGPAAGARQVFTVSLPGLPVATRRLVFAATVDDASPATMRNMTSGAVRLAVAGQPLAEFILQGADYTGEKALMLAEVYWKDQWRVAATGQGFSGGLAALLRHFGGEVAEDAPAPASVPAPAPAPVPPRPSLEKRVEREAPQLVSLAKKASLSLEKNRLANVQARVALVLDGSGSMWGQYQRGEVQMVVDRIMPLAAHFDDDGELDIWVFAQKAEMLPCIALKDTDGYVTRAAGGWNEWMKRISPCVNNEPEVIRQVMAHYAGTQVPAYVVFISDGGVSKKTAIQSLLVEASAQPIFWQFVGIGGSGYGVLEQLDTMTGRVVDNANFFSLDNIRSMTDAELYDSLLREFPDWLKAAKEKGVL